MAEDASPLTHASLLAPGSTCWRVETADRLALFIDNDEAFDALKAILLSARKSIWILAWVFDPLTRLDPDRVRKSRDPQHVDRIGLLLRRQAALNPALDVRILVWDMPFPIAASQLFGPHRGQVFFAGSRVKYHLDNTLPASASHHQKVVVVDGSVALVSGGDIGVDRWDTTQHLDNDPRRRLPTGHHYPARHEVAAMVDGKAAEALGELFISRWRKSTGEILAPSPKPEEAPWPDFLTPDLRSVDLAICRTQPAWKGDPEINETMLMHLACIKSAKRLIYLENQYLTSPIIVEALAERLAEDDGPEVVTVGPAHSPSYFDQMTMDSARTAAINRLHEIDVHGRFSAFSARTPKGAAIIVHSKVAIMDDRVLRLGSANLNNRSIGLDTECDIAFEGRDETSRAAIRAFLGRLIGHFLDHETGYVLETYDREGGLAATINALDRKGGEPRRLAPVPPRQLTGVQQFIADWSLGDATAPDDAWRPWGRRTRLKRELARLMGPPPALPDHLRR
ncbi:phospholipase [Caulobacter sp. Root655]|uniref:phospholipase D-like domain-containing protein n=1 Tax=Caulobacter sp. Root655 TaxID=1736578 RepID=UPI0006FA2115|nr:phospholipase D-like domain-containing protein [Caulobacter sp. Root655]KRA66158.1 phospholipase [Caulobacter sp. Root655]